MNRKNTIKQTLLFILMSSIMVQSNANTPEQKEREELEKELDNNGTSNRQHSSSSTEDIIIVHAPIPVPVNGNTYYDRWDIEQQPTNNGNITDLLKTNPAVRFNDAQNNSMNQGSIDPQLISFHGASPYQNLFLIDGISSTNTMNPNSNNMNDNGTNIIGNTQGYFIDVNLLDSVRVFDSNVPVEYGDFNGGVVDAQLGRFSGDDKLKLSYRTTRSVWNNEYIKDSEKSAYQTGGNGSTNIYTPNYRKNFYTISFDKQLTDTFGFIGGLSHRESSTNRKSQIGDYTYNNKNTDSINTFLGKMSWLPNNNTALDFVIKYNKANHEMQSPSFINSGRDMGSEAYGLAWQYEQFFSNGRLKLNLGWDHMENYTKPDANTLYTEVPCTSLSGNVARCSYGGQGHISEGMDNITAKARWDANTIVWGDIAHTFYGGLDYTYTQGRTERHTTGEVYNINPNTGIITPQTHYKYKTGKETIDVNHYALYLADTIKYQRFSFTPGLRYDYDSFLGNHNLAPRIHAEIDVFNNNQTKLTGGYNRYYGTSFIGMGLRDARNSWKYNAVTGLPVGTTLSNYNDLKTPYSDEWTIGVQQLVDNYVIGLNYVHRFNRDQFTSKGTTTKVYSNDGFSKNDSINLNLGLIEPIQWKQMEINPQLIFSYIKTKGNTALLNGYDDSEGISYDEVIYNGTLMDYHDVPLRDFNIPWVISFNLDFAWPEHNVLLSNTFSYQQKQQSRIIARNGDACYNANYPTVRQYCDVSLSSNINWNIHASWQPNFIKDQPLKFNIDILNVLNRRNTVPYSNTSIMTSNVNLSNYGPGRQVWLQVDYTF